MPLSAEVHQYAADLAFKDGEPNRGFEWFEKFAGDCVELGDYITMLTILAYTKGRTDLPPLFDFLEKCLKSEFEEVRKTASFFTVPRFLKTSRMGQERLLRLLIDISEKDPSETVKGLASAGLCMIGRLSEEAFKRSQERSNADP